MCTAPRCIRKSSSAKPRNLKPTPRASSIEQMLGHVVLEHQLALLAFRVEHNQRLPFGQRLAYAQHAGLQGRFIAIVSAIAGDEVFDEPGQGVDFKCVVGNQHKSLRGGIPAMLLRRDPSCQYQVASLRTSDLPDCPLRALVYRSPSVFRARSDD